MSQDVNTVQIDFKWVYRKLEENKCVKNGMPIKFLQRIHHVVGFEILLINMDIYKANHIDDL